MSGEENSLLNSPEKPLLLVLSGLSGAGKDTVLTRLKQSGFPPVHIITVTTRVRRPGERDGEHYHFISDDKFQEMKAAGMLLESANVYGNWYGVPRKPVREELIARLQQRRTETKPDLDRRIKAAGEELERLPSFDYFVMNRQGEADCAVADIKAIFQAEKCRVKPRNTSL